MNAKEAPVLAIDPAEEEPIEVPDSLTCIERLGSLRRAHAWGAVAHHLGVLVMAGSVAWGGWWLWKRAPWRRP